MINFLTASKQARKGHSFIPDKYANLSHEVFPHGSPVFGICVRESLFSGPFVFVLAPPKDNRMGRKVVTGNKGGLIIKDPDYDHNFPKDIRERAVQIDGFGFEKRLTAHTPPFRIARTIQIV